MNLRVWYGYSRLTKKVIRKRAIAVIFENDFTATNDEWVKKRYHVVYTRLQSEAEMADAACNNRMFTVFYLFIDDKPFAGNLELALTINSLADKNHIGWQERELIRTALRKAFYNIYPKTKNYG